jgi:hypothetical protein
MFGVFGLGWASGGRMRSVETVEWKLGTTNLIPLNLGLPILEGSTHSTVSTVSTIKDNKVSNGN